MRKVHYKGITLAVSFCLIICSFFIPTTKASASNVNNQTVIATVEAEYLNKEVEIFLEEHNIQVGNDGLISLISYSTGTRSVPSTILQVTNFNENQWTISILQAFDIEADGSLKSTDVPIEASSTGPYTSYDYVGYQKKYDMTITFNTYVDVTGDINAVFLRPYQFDFSYSYSKNESASLYPFNKMVVSFQTQGDLYSGTTTFIQSEYTHPMTGTWNNPTVNDIHSKYYPMATNRWIRITTDRNSGMFIVCEPTINNKWDYWTMSVSPKN